MLFQSSLWYKMSRVEWASVERWSSIIFLALHQMVRHSLIWHLVERVVRALYPAVFFSSIHGRFAYWWLPIKKRHYYSKISQHIASKSILPFKLCMSNRILLSRITKTSRWKCAMCNLQRVSRFWIKRCNFKLSIFLLCSCHFISYSARMLTKMLNWHSWCNKLEPNGNMKLLEIFSYRWNEK